VAFLFALHPVRVDQRERKDVSGCCFFALLLAYEGYARAPGASRYALVFVCLVLGLAAKPMLVSAPFVLLLLDAWPLERARERSWARLWLEKVPLFALATLSAALTVWSQRRGGALSTLEVLPLSARLANAPLAALRYVGHFFWPSGLAYFYPHPFLIDPRPELERRRRSRWRPCWRRLRSRSRCGAALRRSSSAGRGSSACSCR
jgi:hypothetical protein